MNTNQTLRQATLAKWSTTIKEWCSQNDVSIHWFYYWKRTAKEEYLKSVMPEIVPVSIPSEPLPVVPAPEASAPAEKLELYNFHNSYNSGSYSHFHLDEQYPDRDRSICAGCIDHQNHRSAARCLGMLIILPLLPFTWYAAIRICALSLIPRQRASSHATTCRYSLRRSTSNTF